MIFIKFQCNYCDSNDGQIDSFFDECVIVCRKCEEHEPIRDYDILGHGTEID